MLKDAILILKLDLVMYQYQPVSALKEEMNDKEHLMLGFDLRVNKFLAKFLISNSLELRFFIRNIFAL